MENNQLIPFERNRYYAGKLLTSTDFQAEQLYMNNKRRFVNSLLFGSGIVCGLSVFNLDDLSIMIESGVAIDSTGREIVVDTSVVKKLSAISGFDSLTSNTASLCLRYQEKPVHPVYSVNRQEKEEEYEYNRINEGYELFLIDKESIVQEFKMESEFYAKGQLYMDSNYLVELVMPAAVSAGRAVKLVLRVEKLSEIDQTFSMDALIQTPAFTTAGSQHAIRMITGLLRLAKGEVVERDYWMDAQHEPLADTSIMAKSEDIRIMAGKVQASSVENFSIKLVISNETPRALITKEVGKTSLEMRNLASMVDYIQLAELNMVRTDSAYIIDSITEKGIKSYISAPSEDERRAEYMEFFSKKGSDGQTSEGGAGRSSASTDYNSGQLANNDMVYATGICEIPLGTNMRRNDIRYSGEIMHGLGKGNVYVEVGYEILTDDDAAGNITKQTIYGDTDMFPMTKADTPLIQTAVKVLNDKGSFIVATKLLRETNSVIVTLRWVAIKFPFGDTTGIQKLAGKSIVAETPTVVLAPKESHYFNVQFRNMEACGVTYALTETGSGEITSDGIYTAPTKEGVYEIRIFVTDTPALSTYAYAVVKKKMVEEKSDGKDKKFKL